MLNCKEQLMGCFLNFLNDYLSKKIRVATNLKTFLKIIKTLSTIFLILISLFANLFV